jgi:hypothetical protein
LSVPQQTWETVRDQVIADFGELWPDYDGLALFELSVESCLLTLTEPDGTFPKGSTVWKAQEAGAAAPRPPGTAS